MGIYFLEVYFFGNVSSWAAKPISEKFAKAFENSNIQPFSVFSGIVNKRRFAV